jgi:hypothetical protein
MVNLAARDWFDPFVSRAGPRSRPRVPPRVRRDRTRPAPGKPAPATTLATKKQTQVRLDEDVLEAGKAAARSRSLDFNRYVERLIIEDTTGARAAGMAAAQRLIDEHGSFLDELEHELDSPYDQQPGTAA